MPLEDLPLPLPNQKFVLPDQSEMGPAPMSDAEKAAATIRLTAVSSEPTKVDVSAPPLQEPVRVTAAPTPPPPPPAPPPPPPPPVPRPVPPIPTHIQESVKAPQPIGPTVGIVIIVIMLLLGAFYFWGEALNRQAQNPPAYIPGDQAQK